MKNIPNSLKRWFAVHFIVDYLFGLPLIIAPAWFISQFGFQSGELLMARLVGAALLGIGGISFIARDHSLETYKVLLLMKIIWSVSAIIGIIISILEGSAAFAWAILGVFVFFSGLWMYYLKRLG